MDSSAIKPTFYQDFTTKVEDVVETSTDADTEALSYITHFRGWTLLKDRKDRLEKFLDESLSNAIASGASMKEVGERALVKELAVFALNSLIRVAEDARRTTDK